MANAFVLRNAYVLINQVDLSTAMREVHVEMTADDVDVTAMGAGGHQHLAGIRDDKLTFTAYSDFTAARVDATVRPLFYAASLFTAAVAASGSTVSATNPLFWGTFALLTYSPISGAVGDAAMTPLELVCNGTISTATT